MEKFIKFQETVGIKDLQKSLSDPRIILLRESQTTNTIQIQVLNDISNREIKTAFLPHHIQKIFDEFPFPLKDNKLSIFSLKSVANIFKKGLAMF